MFADTPGHPHQDEKGATGPNRVSAPSLSLPKGGGAIRGIGEKFAANPVTGTGSLSVPLATSPGRSGFGPQLALTYDSGAGDGPFGFGWHLALPAITRKTDKGLPQYNESEESDVFMLSGAEDLVPSMINVGQQWQREESTRTVAGISYRIQSYRPRIEGLFSRIERWTDLQTGEIHWRSISKDNITTLYGKDNNSRIFDPADATHPQRIFSWLICTSYDDKGNAIVYTYKEENSENLDLTQANERNRDATSRSAQRYLKRIQYGNVTSRLVQPDLTQMQWMFEVVFDYGEHDLLTPQPTESQPWLCRNDPFSTYRACFEVRTYRLCQRVLMFHHFPNETTIGPNYLVRSTNVVYQNNRNNPADLTHGNPLASFIASVTQYGYTRQTDGSYLSQALPPLELTYSQAVIQPDVLEVDTTSLENMPVGLDGKNYRWVDLDAEGIAGILTEQADGWFYKPNLGNGQLGPLQTVGSKPALAALQAGRQQLLSLASDGRLDLVDFAGSTPGFFKRTTDQQWENFTAFTSLPEIAWQDANLRFIDVDGDGFADVLITEHEALTWYPSLAEAGFGPAQCVSKPFEEELGPQLVFADGTQSVYLADMSGDGLTDLVRVRNGEICYWPNLGYGRFGSKVTMDNAPWFTSTELFDQQRVHLADIDGSGTTDLLYLGTDAIQIYFNLSGNSWSAMQALSPLPHLDKLSSVMTVDLLGNGTACLVWSSPLPSDARQPLRYIDLMGGQKPHLLLSLKNNLGAETNIQYASSTKFYLADKLAGQPWITRLAFPVHVVERVETLDHLSGNRFVTRYAYHHGYYDSFEREFRGFGMVEQWDTEELASLTASGTLPPATNIEATSYVPPVLTRSWFHTGIFLDQQHITRQFEQEYYREAGLTDAQCEAMLLDDAILPTTVRLPDGTRQPYNLFGDEAQEACRALKGLPLRQEVYALDGTAAQNRPYSISEQNYTLELLQPQGANRHAVFFAHAREALQWQYERTLYPINNQQVADPRVTHAVTLTVDNFGNVLQNVEIAYGRRYDDPDTHLSDADRQQQKHILLTYSEHQYTNAIQQDDAYHLPLLSETRSYELLNVTPGANQAQITNLFRFDELAQKVQAASDGQHDLPYEDVNAAGATTNAPYRRLLTWSRILYRSDDLSAALPLSQVQSLALPFASYTLALTPGLLATVYQRKNGSATEALVPDPVSVLGNEGRYARSNDLKASGSFPASDPDDFWWVSSGQIFFSPNSSDTSAQELSYANQHFFLAHRYRDPFGATTLVTYDAYDLLLQETQDALGNRFTAGMRDTNNNLLSASHDYRVLQPTVLMDANRNRAAVAFDALGMVVGTALMGKPEEQLGDSLDGFVADLTDATIAAHLQDPLSDPYSVLQRATTRLIYDLFAYQRTQHDSQPQPSVVYTLTRETHDADLAQGRQTKVQHSFAYSDGFGREIQHKMQAEPGPLVAGGPVSNPRWVGSGWTIFNNKGKPVRQYEPFFSATHQFEFALTVGVSLVLFYDSLTRVVATLHPNQTYEKVVFDPWKQASWDVNDAVLLVPQSDPDVGDFFQRIPTQDYTPTWYAQRQAGAIGPLEQTAAQQTAIHANTPTLAYFDTLGHTFLTIVHNRFVRNNAPVDEYYASRTTIDIQGHERAVNDAHERLVMRYDYDMLGNHLHQASMEAGECWTLNDSTGKPIRAWDSRGHTMRTIYDILHRPRELHLSSNNGPELLVGQTIYGETLSNPEARNMRGKASQVFDGSGVVNSGDYDFKGNLLHASRQLATVYKQALDWSTTVALESPIYASSTTYDALNRPLIATSPDSSVTSYTYNEANLLKQVQVSVAGTKTATGMVSNIDYNAKGQRVLITYGNGASTQYEYDPQTFRPVHIFTTRGAAFPGDGSDPTKPPVGVQNLRYTYDPIGNITHMQDDAQQTVYFRNRQITPSADYTYDAIYRLLSATGREHLGQANGAAQVPIPLTNDDTLRMGLLQPGDGNAMGTYLQQYTYDEVGNILQMAHSSTNPVQPAWTRTSVYGEQSLLEVGKVSNRLTSTQIGTSPAQSYTYDVHGNMTTMSHLSLMQWDYKDQLEATAQQVVTNGGTPETTWYVYDSTGQRVRKVTERQAASGQTPTRLKERIYLGGFEIYREYGGDGNTISLERETLPIMDDQQRVALIETRTQGSDQAPQQLTRYQFSNHLGTACLELDEQAQIITYEEYYPFGSTSYQAVRSATETPKRYRYTGKERDEENGLYYHGARYYACWLGRWTAADPAGLKAGMNAFAYVKNNPIMLFDPNGQDGQMGFWHFQAEYWKGVGQGAAEFAGGIGHMVAHPIDTAHAMSNAASQAYQQDGTIGAINQFNPLYHAAIAGIKYYDAAKSGNPREAGRQAFRVVSGVASTALIATGAGGALGGGGSATAEATSITLNVPTEIAPLATDVGEVSITLVTRPVTIPIPAVVPQVATAGAGVLMMTANGPGGPPNGNSGSSGSSSSSSRGSGNSRPSERGQSRSSRSSGQSGSGTAAPAARPSLLQQAMKAGVREEIEEGPIEVFAHGTTASTAKELIDTQGGNLAANSGNFGGKFFTVPSIDVAKVFAARTASKVAGSEPSVVGMALPKAIADRLRSQGLLRLRPIDSPPVGVSAGAQEWVFEPGALPTLQREGFFFQAH